MSSDANDNENRGQGSGLRAPLTLKPRPGGSISSGTVKQSFSHGRSKTVVVETKRRIGATPPPSTGDKRPAFDLKPRTPTTEPVRPAPPSADAASKLNLSAEEAARRQRAVEAAREQQERQAAQRRADDNHRAVSEAPAAAPAAPAAEPPPPAPAAIE